MPAGLTGKWAWAGVIETEDVDEHREAVRPWDLTIRQVSPGKYRARTEYVSLGGILLYREQCNRRLMVTGATPAGYLVLGTPSAANLGIGWCGAELHPGRLAFGRSSTEVNCVVPAGSHHVVALVPEDLPRTYLDEALGSKLLSRECRHLVCRPSVGESLIRLVQRLVDEYLERPELLTDRKVCNAIESELLGILFQAVDSTDTGVGCVSARERYLAFLRAISYTEHLQLPIGVAELAAAANVSRRVLELAFRETLGVPPVTYLRFSRMHGVRRELAAASPDSARVKDICARWGFSEPGRFAVEYGHLFGESPSATLRTNREPPPTRLEDALRRVRRSVR